MTARILVVDDILPNVKLLEAKLTAEYFDVLTAQDGLSALRVAAEEAPDLILLDVMMPGMNGFEVCQRLKADTATQHIPIIMVTALSDVSDRVRGLEAGADDFLSKPVNDVALFARVRSLVRLKMTMDELRLRQASTGEASVFETESLDDEEEMAGARVLVIEDSALTAGKMVEGLRGAGYTVDHARAAADGRKLAREHAYDMVITALDIRGEDGLRLCSHFRSQDQTRHVPILLVLESVDLPKLAKGLDLGVNDYLIKPVDRNELLARSRTQIRRRRYHNQLRQMLQRSVSMAYTDSLTGLYNRRYMNTTLDRRILEIAETAKPVSVLMFDIDHFKPINDVYGHSAGDEVLKILAKRVMNGVRDVDLVARYGGEEFVVIMPDTPLTVALKIGERLRNMVAEEPFSIPDCSEPLAVTISLGAATATDPMEEAASLLKRADDALYAAKNMGRNRIESDRHNSNVTPLSRAAMARG